MPVLLLLLRAPGVGQTERSGAERRRGPVPRARSGAVPSGACVLLVDDVVITGATMGAAVVALQSAGSGPVVAVSVARTPR